MNIESLYGKKGVEFINITNDVGLEVTLSNFGASIYQIKLDLEEMTLTPKYFDTFFHNTKYYGLTVGRIAGRMKNGILKVGDKQYQLEQNEGTNCLHGGVHSIAFKKWRTEIKTYKEYIIVKFHLTTKKGEAGFNGKCEYVVAYRIHADSNIIDVRYDAVCKEDTLFALTNHTYFNLGHEKTILDHHLRIKANEVSTLDEEDFTITGYKPVDDTIFDFREAKLLKKTMNDPELHSTKWLNGYDHRFHLAPVEEAEANISLASGFYKLDIYTNFDSVHVYTNGFTNHDLLISDDYDDVYRGIALECSSLAPEFTPAKQHYVHHVKYVFRRKSDEK